MAHEAWHWLNYWNHKHPYILTAPSVSHDWHCDRTKIRCRHHQPWGTRDRGARRGEQKFCNANAWQQRTHEISVQTHRSTWDSPDRTRFFAGWLRYSRLKWSKNLRPLSLPNNTSICCTCARARNLLCRRSRILNTVASWIGMLIVLIVYKLRFFISRPN